MYHSGLYSLNTLSVPTAQPSQGQPTADRKVNKHQLSVLSPHRMHHGWHLRTYSFVGLFVSAGSAGTGAACLLGCERSVRAAHEQDECGSIRQRL